VLTLSKVDIPAVLRLQTNYGLASYKLPFTPLYAYMSDRLCSKSSYCQLFSYKHHNIKTDKIEEKGKGQYLLRYSSIFGTPYTTFTFSVHFKPSVQIPAAFNSHGVQFSIILVVNERINVRLLHNINCNNIFSTFEQSLEEVYARRVIEIASAEYQPWCCQCTGHSL